MAQPARLPNDDRRDPRFETQLLVDVRTPDGLPLVAEARNISLSGFKAYSPIRLKKGTRLRVGLVEGKLLRARVVWQDEDVIGCTFLRPLEPGQLEELLRG